MRKSFSVFVADRRGAVAVLAAFALVPILITVGAGADLMRVMVARTELQSAVDSAALAAMSGSVQFGNQGWVKNANGQWVRSSDSSLPSITDSYIKQNFSTTQGVNAVTTTTPDWVKGTITVNAKAAVPTYLLAIAGVNNINISASATASVTPPKIREIALAFDVTYSMNDKGRKQAAIAAAKNFIQKVMNNPDGSPNPYTRVALVPFNNYVNIGGGSVWDNTAIGKTWLNGTSDYKVVFFNAYCSGGYWVEYSQPIYKYQPYTYDCSVDGVKKTCTGQIPVDTGVKKDVKSWIPYKCYPEASVTYKFFGCVGSIKNTAGNLFDETDLADSTAPVQAFLEDSNGQYCPNQRIIYLSSNESTSGPNGFTFSRTAQENLAGALDKIIFDKETYIAPGLLWAWRVLSPEKPVAGWFVKDANALKVDAQDNLRAVCGDYDPNKYAANQDTVGLKTNGLEKPGCPYGITDKAIVLMTDGFNTRFASYNDDIRGSGFFYWRGGMHESTDTDPNSKFYFNAANAKTKTICDNIKKKGIKIFTIAFMVNDSTANQLLADCASDPSYFFNAGDSQALDKAFQTIGANMSPLRLIK